MEVRPDWQNWDRDVRKKVAGMGDAKVGVDPKASKGMDRFTRSTRNARQEADGLGSSTRRVGIQRTAIRDVDRFGGGLGRARGSSEGLHGSLLRAKIVAGALAAIPAGQGLAGIAAGAIGATASLGPLTGALVAIPNLSAAAAQGITTVLLAGQGLGDTIGAAFDAQDDAGQSASSSLAQAASNAEAMRSAERGLQDASRQSLFATEELTAARAAARRELRDLKDAVDQGALSERGAEISLQRAKDDLKKAQAEGSGLDVEEAYLRVDQAREDLDQARTGAARARKDYNAAERAGVRGSPQVVAAERAKADAVRAMGDANYQLGRAGQQAAAGTATASAAASRYEQELAKLSPEARAFALQIIGMRGDFDQLRASSGRELFPGVGRGVAEASRNLPVLNKLLEQTGGELGGVAEDAGRLVGSPAFGRDMAIIGERNALWVGDLGGGMIDLGQALTHLMIAGGPFTDWLFDTATEWAALAREEAEAGRRSGETAAYFERTRAKMEQLGRIIQSLSSGFYEIGKASTPLGDDLWRSIDRGAQRFENWTKSVEGQRALTDFFEDAHRAGRRFGNEVDHLIDRYGELRRQGKTRAEAFTIVSAQGASRAMAHAATEMARTAPKVAPQVASAFWEGFQEASTGGKLLTAGFILSRIGGGGGRRGGFFGAGRGGASSFTAGLQSGLAGGIGGGIGGALAQSGAEKLGTRGGKVGKLGGAIAARGSTPANPLYVLDVAGGGGGGKGKGGKGAPGVPPVVAGGGSRALGLLGRAGVGGALAYGGYQGVQQAREYARGDIRGGLNRAANFSQGLTPGGGASVGAGLMRNSVSGGIGSDRTREAQASLKQFEGQLARLRLLRDPAGMERLQRQIATVGRSFRGTEFAPAFGQMGRDADALKNKLRSTFADRLIRSNMQSLATAGRTNLHALRSTVDVNLNAIKAKLGTSSAEGRRALQSNFKGATNALGTLLRSGKVSTDTYMTEIERLARSHSRGSRESIGANFDGAVRAIKTAMREGTIATDQGLAAIRRLSLQALKLYGFSGKEASKLFKAGVTAGDVSKGKDIGKALGRGPQGLPGKQRGGPIDMGRPSGDSVPAMLERGEYVMNREAVRAVGQDRLDAVNFGAAPRFQKGGGVGMPQGGFPDADGALPGMDALAWVINKKFGLGVTDGRRPGGTRTTSGNVSDHTFGTALDLSNGSQPTPQMDAAHAFMRKALGAGGPWRENYQGGGIKQMLYRTGIGGNHFNHIHVALVSALANSASRLMGAIGGDLSGLAAASGDGAAGLRQIKVGLSGIGADSPMGAIVAGALSGAAGGANQRLKEAHAAAAAATAGGDVTTSLGGSDAGFRGGGNAAENRALGKRMAAARGWDGEEWKALDFLWGIGESAWDHHADNPTSSAFGIPQAMGHLYPETTTAEWRNSPPKQIAWGLDYIKNRYGSPTRALAFWRSKSPHWYQQGGEVEMQAGGPPAAAAAKKSAKGKNVAAFSPAKLKKAAPQKLKNVAASGALRAHFLDAHAQRFTSLTNWIEDEQSLLSSDQQGFMLDDVLSQDELNSLVGRAGGIRGAFASQLNLVRDALVPDTQRKVADFNKLVQRRTKRVETLVAKVKADREKSAKIAEKEDKERKAFNKIKKPTKAQKQAREKSKERHAKQRGGLGDNVKGYQAELKTLTGDEGPDVAKLGTLGEEQGLLGQTIKKRDDYKTALTDTPGWENMLRPSQLPSQLRDADYNIAELLKQGATKPDNTEGERATAERNELLKEELRLERLRTAVSERGFDVFKQTPSPRYGGTFHGGGIVPGPRNADMAITARSGEGVFTEEQMEAIGGDGGSIGDIRVIVHGDIISDRADPIEILVGDRRFEAAVQRVTRRDVVSGSRFSGARGGR